MKIIIPMAGFGERFVKAGYREPKPLVKVDGMPVIYHIVSMFSPSDEFIFICNREHTKNTSMVSVLRRAAPNSQIVAIEPHSFGPVYTTKFAFDLVKNDEPVIVCYCDFYEDWDYDRFKKTVLENKCDAAVTAYKGFHPHLLGTSLYASMRVDENNWMLECREKHSFTENKMDSYQQTGKFYFARGSLMKKFFKEAAEKRVLVNNELFISVVTQLMAETGFKIYVYPVNYFLQWGTPKDMREYMEWSAHFARLAIKSGFEVPSDIVSQGIAKPRKNGLVEQYWKDFFSRCGWHPYTGN